VPKISEPSVLLKESLLHSSLKDVILAPPVWFIEADAVIEL
jgi:hypothetical protein